MSYPGLHVPPALMGQETQRRAGESSTSLRGNCRAFVVREMGTRERWGREKEKEPAGWREEA